MKIVRYPAFITSILRFLQSTDKRFRYVPKDGDTLRWQRVAIDESVFVTFFQEMEIRQIDSWRKNGSFYRSLLFMFLLFIVTFLSGQRLKRLLVTHCSLIFKMKTKREREREKKKRKVNNITNSLGMVRLQYSWPQFLSIMPLKNC